MTFSRLISYVAAAATVFTLYGFQAQAYAEASSEKTKSQPKVSKQVVDAISKRFSEARSDLKVMDVLATDVNDVYQVFFEGKGSVYAVGKGDFFFVGDLFQIDGQRIVNVTEQQSNGPRAELIASIKKDDMIVFSPKGEVKASVVVFTDVDCGYCRKLHNEMAKMNELGIEVKYLAYPRAGIGSNSYKKIASAWCADDRLNALNTLKAGGEIPENVCNGNPVENQFNIGIRAGLNGTPAIVLESGELIPGYMPAEKLAQTLGI